jgi:hypothetical protein
MATNIKQWAIYRAGSPSLGLSPSLIEIVPGGSYERIFKAAKCRHGRWIFLEPHSGPAGPAGPRPPGRARARPGRFTDR